MCKHQAAVLEQLAQDAGIQPLSTLPGETEAIRTIKELAVREFLEGDGKITLSDGRTFRSFKSHRMDGSTHQFIVMEVAAEGRLKS